jgi:uncharacterized protein YabN with tetrapyrrole methylase and pyrophosphatase domain
MKEFDTLWELVKHLRQECPWDKEQTFETAKEHVVEEAQEIKEAIEKKDWSNLNEELGDTLFNILFVALLAEEAGHFDLKKVLADNHEKMVRRHPHVFGEIKASTPEEAMAAFLKAKAEEKEDK